MVEVRLKGLLARGFSAARAPLMQFDVPQSPEYRHDNPPIEVHDARELQSTAKSEAAFFDEHGFVLLKHATAVKDWDRDIAAIYQAEIAQLIRNRLLPDNRTIIHQAPSVVRRGHQRRFYAEGVHSDGPLTLDAYVSNIRAMISDEAACAWQQTLASDEIAGFILVNFWRTTNMKEPLRHMPLALCEPNSLLRSDLIPNTIASVAPKGRLTEHLALRFNASQRWYYYPQMTPDEVLAFKLFQYSKDDPDAALQNVFHSAFEDPHAPEDCEPRQSCEHRAGVMILRD